MLRLGRADEAEDAVQEALLGAVTASRDAERAFAGRSAERTWLIGILRHKVLDTLRRRGRSGVGGDPADLESCGCGAGETWLGYRKQPWPEAKRAEDGAAFRAAVREALAELPEPMRLAVVLREIDGVSGAEACEVLGVTPTNLWTLVHRGKARLRERLSVWWIERGDP